MARYSLLEQPLPPGQTTIREYGRRIGRSPEYIRVEWGARQGFPVPVGQLRPRGRNGGGLGELVYETGALDAFRASQEDLWGIRAVAAVVTDRDLDERVSLGEFAAQVAHEDLELVARYRGLDGFPAGDARGRYRLGDLIGYWNTRPLLITDRDRAERVTLGHFADHVVGKSRKTVTQYRDQLPPAGDDGRYPLGVLVDFWNYGRPGKRGPAAKSRAA